MKEKSLIETNPFLSDPKKRNKAFLITASSSIAVEGVRISPKRLALIKHLKSAKSIKLGSACSSRSK